MIKLLTPISHLFYNESNAQEIANHSDELEARERTCDLRKEKTTHYHIDFDLNLGLRENELEFLENKVKEREDIHTLTFQASRDCQGMRIVNGMYTLESEAIDIEKQLMNTKESVKKIRDIVGSWRNIGIENNNYFPTGAYDICTSTAYLIRALEVADIHLLFDIAHAKVTAVNKDCCFETYAKTLLDTTKCKQIHICEHGLYVKEKKLLARDAHDIPTTSTTYQTLGLCKEYNIDYLTVEFYKDPKILSEYLKRIKSVI